MDRRVVLESLGADDVLVEGRGLDVELGMLDGDPFEELSSIRPNATPAANATTPVLTAMARLAQAEIACRV
ncbi:MAG: hypothetical protein AAFZ07_04030 [Actinomycetota bacterium]